MDAWKFIYLTNKIFGKARSIKRNRYTHTLINVGKTSFQIDTVSDTLKNEIEISNVKLWLDSITEMFSIMKKGAWKN